MTYPTQYAQPQMPGFPTSPAPAPGYPAQAFGQPQSYPQQYAQPQQQTPQLATGSLDAFYSQPSTGGGAALKFDVNTRHVGVVSRLITNADIQQQTNPANGQPAFYKDGRPKFVMKVPLQLQPSADRPDGLGQWYVAGAARDELARAMAEAGAPEGPPEPGAVLDITCTGTRPSGPGMNPAKVYKVVYTRPQGAASAQTAPAMSTATGHPVVHQQAVPAVPAAQPPLPPAPAANTGPLSPEQQQLLAQLTGQPVG